MHATLVTFDIDPSHWDEERDEDALQFAVADARDVEHLQSKSLLADPDTGARGGFYLFDSQEDAENFFDDERIERFADVMGAAPQLRHFVVPAHVDNVTGSVRGAAVAQSSSP